MATPFLALREARLLRYFERNENNLLAVQIMIDID